MTHSLRYHCIASCVALGFLTAPVRATPLLNTGSVSQFVEGGSFSGDLRDSHAGSVQVQPAVTNLTSHFGGYSNGYPAATFGMLKARTMSPDPTSFKPALLYQEFDVGLTAQ